MAKHDKTADLLRVLGQRPPTSPAPAKLPQPPVARLPATKTSRLKQSLPVAVHSSAKPSRGRAIHLYLHPQDEKLIRELAVWLSPHRKRINDSLVIKAVLRTATTGAPLLAAYDDAVQVDGRFHSKKQSAQDGHSG